MTSIRNLLIVLMMITFAACGGGSEPSQVEIDEVPESVEPSATAETQTVDESSDTASLAALEAVEESAGEESSEQTGDDTIVLAEAEPTAEVTV
jgi:hypothetical protein